MSNVYYIQEVESNKYEVYFGDGVVSELLSDGNIVELSYVVTNKTAKPNGANEFASPTTIDSVSDISTTLISRAFGGAEPESIQSIKLQAPLDYSAQGRSSNHRRL